MKHRFSKLVEKTRWYILRNCINYEDNFLYEYSTTKFFKKIMDPQFNYKDIKGYNPYFLKWGYKFPRFGSVYYSLQTGVESDLYLPVGLYDRYIFPFLDHDAWHWGYADKNMFSRLLDIKDAQKYVDVLEPEYIVYCDNGRFFRQGNVLCTKNEAVDSVLQFNDSFIIKPTIESHSGKGVKKIKKEEINPDSLSILFDEYGNNFTIQKVIVQHPDLAALNPTSVNTIRITTYQNPRGEVKILYATQRFGAVGQVFDNASNPHSSGGWVAIMEDGTYKRDIHHYNNMEIGHLNDNLPTKAPYFEKVKECVKFMHTRFPHFALIGWDISVTPEGHPLIVEYNFRPDIGMGQLSNGPLFGKDDLVEIMEGISKCKIVPFKKPRVVFANRPAYWT